MVRVHCLAVVLILTLAPGVAEAQENGPRFQYRYRGESIPAAVADEPRVQQFSSEAARDHLDTGAALWAQQKKCVSCHTHGIYTFTRPALTPYWGEPPAETRDFVAAQAEQIIKGGASSGSTPVQMAYIARGLAAWDAHAKRPASPETDAALRYLLSLQAEDGSISVKYRWPPINSTTYYGTVMAAMAAADAPGWLATLDESQLVAKIERLKNYLRETPPKNDHQRLLLLWASTRIPDLVSGDRRGEFLEMLWRQQQEDGGWSLRTFATPESLGGGKRAEKLKTDPGYLNPESDGYQTGLAVVVLRDAGIAADDPRIAKAVEWLQANQRASGRWWTQSLNTDSRFHFISYSGTAYAALALAKCGALPKAAQ